MQEKPEKFKKCVQKCLRYHVVAINKLVEDGMIFWDYDNGLQEEAKRSGIPCQYCSRNVIPIYTAQHVMLDIVSLLPIHLALFHIKILNLPTLFST